MCFDNPGTTTQQYSSPTIRRHFGKHKPGWPDGKRQNIASLTRSGLRHRPPRAASVGTDALLRLRSGPVQAGQSTDASRTPASEDRPNSPPVTEVSEVTLPS